MLINPSGGQIDQLFGSRRQSLQMNAGHLPLDFFGSCIPGDLHWSRLVREAWVEKALGIQAPMHPIY